MLNHQTLKELQNKQKELDDFIIKKKSITDTKDKGGFVWGKVALLVEIGELANELATFKRWKSQKEVNWDKAREELIDCLHFYLSFTNTFQIDFSDYNKLQEEFSKRNDNIVPYDLSPQSINRYNELLLSLFSETEKMIVIDDDKADKENFYRWLIAFEELAQKMGMKSEEDIKKAYSDKNDENWKRQNKNY